MRLNIPPLQSEHRQQWVGAEGGPLGVLGLRGLKILLLLQLSQLLPT